MKKRYFSAAAVLFCAIFFSACGASGGALIPERDGIQMTDGQTVFLKEIDGEAFFAANFFVSQNGAKANGKTDDTEAIRRTLQKAAQAGGGTVYLPLGTYKITGPIEIPDNVTMKGDFTSPTAKNPSGRKTQIVISGKGFTETPAITLGENTALCGVQIRYEGQRSNEVQEYPFTIAQTGGGKVKICDVELINSYRGISVGNEACEKITLENLYITALKIGIEIHQSKDLTTLEKITVSQRYWSNFPKEKEENYTPQAAADTIAENLTAITIDNPSDVSLTQVEIDAGNIAVLTNVPKDAGGMISVTGLSVSGTKHIFETESLGLGGLAAANCMLQTTGLIDSRIVSAGENFETQMLFNTCTFPGQPYESFVSEGTGDIAFANCTFSGWRKGAFHLTDGVVTAVNNTFSSRETVGVFENPALAIFYNNTFPQQAYANADYFFEQNGETTYTLTALQSEDLSFSEKAAGKTSTAVYADDFGMSTEAESNNQALQQAVDSFGTGGGTVFIREGEYRFDATPITLKSNVSLCGVGNAVSKNYNTTFIFSGADGSAITAVKGSRISGIRMICEDSADNTAILSENSAGLQLKDLEICDFATGIKLTKTTNLIIKNCDFQVSSRGITLTESSDVLIKNCRFLPQDAQKKADQRQTLTALNLIGGENIRLSANTVESAMYALSINLPGNASLKKTIVCGLFVSDTTGAVNIAATAGTVLCNCKLCPSDNGEVPGSYLEIGKNNPGTVLLANAVYTGNAAQSAILLESGNAEMQTSAVRAQTDSILRISGGNLTAGANLIYTNPTAHIRAENGNTVFMGNLVESEIEFAAMEGDYVKESVSGNANAVCVFNAKRCDIQNNIDVSEIQ